MLLQPLTIPLILTYRKQNLVLILSVLLTTHSPAFKPFRRMIRKITITTAAANEKDRHTNYLLRSQLTKQEFPTDETEIYNNKKKCTRTDTCMGRHDVWK